MAGAEHPQITEFAVGLLPQWQRELLEPERDRLVREYCTLPDRYFGIQGGGHEEARPYHFETDGVQFHYLPDTNIAPLYRYYAVDEERGRLKRLLPFRNEHWRHASRGFVHYVTKSIESLRAGRLRDGCAFAGCLLHFLQDSGFGAHSMEGPEGVDFFILQRLFPEPEDLRQDPICILGSSSGPPESGVFADCAPRLLGFTPEETAFHLYARHVEVTTTARRLCHRIVVNAHEGRGTQNQSLFDEMFRNATCLCADALFTILCNAAGRFPDDTGRLLRVALSDMAPIQRPWVVSPPYRYTAVIRDRALNLERERIPLALRFEPGGARVTFDKGLGTGAHYEFSIVYDVPRGVYRTFRCAVGLHADLYELGDVRITLLQDGTPFHASRFNAGRPAERVSLQDPGGRLELKVEADDGLAGVNSVVWAEPVLERAPSA